MESIIQINNLSKTEFISIIEGIIEDRLNGFKKSKEPKNLTIQETSKLLGVTDLTIRNYIKKGILPASKIGRRVIISRIDIENALKDVKSLKYKRDV